MENNNIQKEVLDKLTKTCVCKVVTRAKVKEAIRNGALTIDEVKKATGAATGSCGGARCVYKIYELIDEYKENGDFK